MVGIETRIPFIDVPSLHRALEPELREAVMRVVLETKFDMCDELPDLERELGAFMDDGAASGVSAIAVQSGTAALFLALKALGVGPGDEVITVPNSDLATTAAISHTGARFVLVDVDPETFNMDPARVEPLINKRTRAIIPVHLFGNPAPMKEIMALARARNVAVIEDACIALGARYGGRTVGLIGDLGCVSFSPRKLLGAAGNGGLVVTKDPALADRVRILRGYGQDPALGVLPHSQRVSMPDLQHLVEGYNLRMDSVQAAVLRVKLRHYPAWQKDRQAVARIYDEALRGTAARPQRVLPGAVSAYRDYAVLLPERDRVRSELAARGIATAARYIPPVHLQPVYREAGYGPGSLPAAEAVAESVLSLPIYGGMPLDHAREVADTLKALIA